jgi:hypothetical protein
MKKQIDDVIDEIATRLGENSLNILEVGKRKDKA